MNPAAKSRFLEDTKTLEGVTTWLYLDVRGLVTIGIGNLVDPVGLLWMAKLDWRWGKAPNDREATDEEVWSIWSKTKAYQSWKLLGGGHRKWQELSPLRATEESILALVDSKVDRFFAALVGYFPEMPGWPGPAQEALMLMAWAMGPAFPPGWPKLTAALRRLDFTAAAIESRMSEASQNWSFHQRNILVGQRFQEAAQQLGDNS